MKRTGFYLILSFSVGLGALLSSCTKKKEEPVEPVEEVKKKEVKQSDQSGTSAADEALDDVNNYINNEVGGGSNKRVEAYNLPCGSVSIDSTTIAGVKVYKINYGSKTKCGYKYKSGTVAFQLTNGTGFNEVGSVFKMTFKDYVVEVEATGDIVKINGYITSTNVTGGYVWEVVTSTTPKAVTHRIRGSYDVTYANGAIRNKKYYHTRTWASNNSWAGLNFTVAGDTITNPSEPGKTSEIGKTLDGDYYYETHMINDFNWFNTNTTYAGPYVLRVGKARMVVTVPAISPTYFEVEAGYNTTNGVVSATPVNNANSNTYKITTVFGTTTITQYQLY